MKTILIGFDAFDPVIFEKLHAQGKTPNLSAFVEAGTYARFAVTNPPQSEVSWTSIATGMNPGEHGIFDFVHRNPETYACDVSLLPTRKGVLGRQFVPPHKAPTLFDVAVEDGYPAVSLWWPATFPARRESPVWTIPGLGTPDIFGRLGVGVFYALEPPPQEGRKTRMSALTRVRAGQFEAALEGPAQMTLSGLKGTSLPFELSAAAGSAQLAIGRQKFDLRPGAWSQFIELTFKVGFGVSVRAVTRALLTKADPDPGLYFLPLQLHPLGSPWPYGTPMRLMKEVWRDPGPYLTLGWPQDTTGLEDGLITGEQFLDLCVQIRDHRERTLMRRIDSYREGVLACVFDSLDRVQHMVLRDQPEVVEDWYVRLDALFGRIRQKLAARPDGANIHLMVVSDHGFGEYRYQVHLNRWLVENGYLTTGEGEAEKNLGQADWARTRAYAVGLNSVYLNQAGREAQGAVAPGDADLTLEKLRQDLLRWKGPDGRPVVRRALTRAEAFYGPLAAYGPDLVVGYQPGYRASAETGLGEWADQAIEPNRDRWGADHCFDAEAVPGVLFSSRGLDHLPNPSYADIPMLAIGKSIRPLADVAAPTYSDEDRETVEKRLKELGYL